MFQSKFSYLIGRKVCFKHNFIFLITVTLIMHVVYMMNLKKKSVKTINTNLA